MKIRRRERVISSPPPCAVAITVLFFFSLARSHWHSTTTNHHHYRREMNCTKGQYPGAGVDFPKTKKLHRSKKLVACRRPRTHSPSELVRLLDFSLPEKTPLVQLVLPSSPLYHIWLIILSGSVNETFKHAGKSWPLPSGC